MSDDLNHYGDGTAYDDIDDDCNGATGNKVDDNCDGAAGKEVNDDCDGAMGDKVDKTSSSASASFPPRRDGGAPCKIPSDGGGSNNSRVFREFGIREIRVSAVVVVDPLVLWPSSPPSDKRHALRVHLISPHLNLYKSSAYPITHDVGSGFLAPEWALGGIRWGGGCGPWLSLSSHLM